MRYRLDISYEGCEFVGWQLQPNGPSIQGAIENALKTAIRQNTRVLGASRTDSGVHAWQQVCTFKYDALLDINKTIISLNALLPEAIKIVNLQIVPDEFHPITSAKQKTYLYRIWNERKAPPLLRRNVWAIRNILNVGLMRDGLNQILGEHNFKAFMATDSAAKTSVRKIFEVELEANGPDIKVWITGNGFLKQMVRSIVGTLVAIGEERFPVNRMQELLQSAERQRVGPTAAAQGLMLAHIDYIEMTKISLIKAKINML